jgi:GNAT superfamily N-acetyltransferase
MHIRPAHAHDVTAIARVHVESWRTTYTGIVPDDFLASLSYAQRERLWHQFLTPPGNQTIVYVAADASDQVVGFASGGPERSGDTIYTGELYAIYLLAAYQRRGIGRQLMTTLVSRLFQDGMTALLLWVLAANPARQFYERLGGKQIYTKTVTMGNTSLDEIAYGWQDARRLIAHASG